MHILGSGRVYVGPNLMNRNESHLCAPYKFVLRCSSSICFISHKYNTGFDIKGIQKCGNQMTNLTLNGSWRRKRKMTRNKLLQERNRICTINLRVIAWQAMLGRHDFMDGWYGLSIVWPTVDGHLYTITLLGQSMIIINKKMAFNWENYMANLRERMTNKEIQLLYTRSYEQATNFLTEGVSWGQLQRVFSNLGIWDIRAPMSGGVKILIFFI